MSQEKIKIAEFQTASSTSQTSSTFYSDTPYSVAAWKSEIIQGYAAIWGNTDNVLRINVQWGIVKEGEYPSDSTNKIYWIDDLTIQTTINANLGISTIVPFNMYVPATKGLYRRLKFSLTGTAQTVDLIAYSLPDAISLNPVNNSLELGNLNAGVLNADLVPAIDVSAFSRFSLQINTSAYVGTLTFQASNDNINFLSYAVQNTNVSPTNGPATSTTNVSNIIYAAPIQFRYLRIRMTSYTSGSAQGTLELYTTSDSHYAGATSIIGGNISNNTADSGNPVKIGGVYNSIKPILTSGNRGDLQLSQNGAQIVEQYFSYTHISTTTTTTIKSGAGFVHNISVNTKGTAASIVTVYDNTTATGTVIGIIDSLNLSGLFLSDVAFATGLTIVTTGAPDLTVSYR